MPRTAGRMTRARVFGSVLAALAGVGVAAVFAISWRPAIPAIDPPAPQTFDATLMKRGRVLAAIGNCASCHTVRGAPDYAGGLPVATPFGTIYSTNTTPDAETGIGRWSEIANAIANATGKRLRDLPLTRKKIKDAIDA
jgi:mono/diheme cytochrome c family protein